MKAIFELVEIITHDIIHSVFNWLTPNEIEEKNNGNN